MFNKTNIGDYNKKELLNAFLKVGIKKKDSLFITTNLGLLGVPQTNNKKFMLTSSMWLMENLRQIIGNQGNIFVPTYSYSFAKKKNLAQQRLELTLVIFQTFF
jgi:aminoglycoside N3'-acetyltransferase